MVYHIWPHYRAGVVQALDRSERIAFDFFGSGQALEGIEHLPPGRMRRFVRAPSLRMAGLTWQSGAVGVALRRRYDAVVYLGDIHFVSTWLGAALCRLRGTSVLFWAHGWLRAETGVRRRLRDAYYRLANRMLVYSERGARLGTAAGYPAERITTIYNSLDVERADAIVARIESDELADLSPRALFAAPERPLLVCTARLTAKCRFDLLIDAAARLGAQGLAVNLLLVGEGPERARLEAQARRLGVTAVFYGACYDEELIGQFIYHADITVSPGKIGLTAMHSMMYGTPAVTHGNLDQQMPEVEAIVEGRTGAFFRQGDAQDLARAIAAWLRGGRDRTAVRRACREVIHRSWNPANQARIIEDAILGLVGRG